MHFCPRPSTTARILGFVVALLLVLAGRTGAASAATPVQQQPPPPPPPTTPTPTTRPAAELPQELAARVTRAIAVIRRANGQAFTNAVCIDPSGYYLTREGFSTEPKEKMRWFVVPNPTDEPAKRRLMEAKVAAVDDVAGLMLLKVDNDEPLPALALAKPPPDSARLPAISFAYSTHSQFNAEFRCSPMASSDGEFSLRPHSPLADDGLLSPAKFLEGQAGGAVVDSAGNLLGIVDSGVVQGGSVTVISVGKMGKLFSKPVVAFRPPSLDADKAGRACDFVVRLVPPQDTGNLSVEMLIGPGPTDRRTFPMKRTPNGEFHATAVPLSAGGKGAGAVAYTVVVKRGEKVLTTYDATVPLTGDATAAGGQGIPAGGSRTLPLPANAEHVTIAGNGRYLLLSAPGRVMVFDAADGTLRTLPVDAGRFAVAGGADKLVIALTDKNLVGRWDLASLKREAIAALGPADAGVTDISMGSGTAGPVFLRAAASPRLLDLQTLKSTPLVGDTGLLMMREGNGELHSQDYHVSQSADGRSLIVFGPHSFSALSLGGFDGNALSIIQRTWRTTEYFGRFDPEGGLIFQGRDGVFNRQGEQVAGRRDKKEFFEPAVDGSAFFVGLVEPPGSDGGRVFVYRAADAGKPLISYPPFPELSRVGLPRERDRTVPAEQPVYLFTAYDLIVTLPPRGESLVLRRAGLEEALGHADPEYLFVSSVPGRSVRPGGTYVYQLDARTRRGPVTYRLESGPPGAIVSPTGRLEWNVPASYSNAEASFVVAATSAAGRSTSQGFTVNVIRPAAVPVAAGGSGEDRSGAAATTAPSGTAPSDIAAQAPGAVAGGAVRPDAHPDPRGFEVALPGPADDMALAAGGKYIVYVCKSAGKLVVFDTDEARVVRELPLPPEPVLCAGTAEHLFVVLPQRKVIQRWRLADWRRDRVAPLPLTDAPVDVAAGCAGHGPLLVQTRSGPRFIDVQTLLECEPKLPPFKVAFCGERFQVRAEPAGDTFVGWEPKYSATGIKRIQLRGPTVEYDDVFASSTDTSIADGGALICASSGLYGPDLRPLKDARFDWNRSHAVPAVGTPFFFGIDHSRVANDGPLSVSLYLVADRTRVMDIPALANLPVAWNGKGEKGDPFPLDRRLHARLPSGPVPGHLIVLLPGRERLRVLPFDPAAAMAAAGQHFLFFATTVAEAAKRGQPYSFFLDARSDRTPVSFRLVTGPRGMTVSNDGEVRWAAAAPDPYSSAASIVVTARDAGGKELRRTFRIVVH